MGIVLLAILLERGMFYEQLMYDIITKWNIHVQRVKGVHEFWMK